MNGKILGFSINQVGVHKDSPTQNETLYSYNVVFYNNGTSAYCLSASNFRLANEAQGLSGADVSPSNVEPLANTTLSYDQFLCSYSRNPQPQPQTLILSQNQHAGWRMDFAVPAFHTPTNLRYNDSGISLSQPVT